MVSYCYFDENFSFSHIIQFCHKFSHMFLFVKGEARKLVNIYISEYL